MVAWSKGSPPLVEHVLHGSLRLLHERLLLLREGEIRLQPVEQDVENLHHHNQPEHEVGLDPKSAMMKNSIMIVWDLGRE